MTASGMDVVRAFYDALNRRDEAALHALCTHDAELRTHIGSVTGRVYGHGELQIYLGDVADVWEHATQTVMHLGEVEDGRLLASVRFEARARGSGVVTDQVLGVLFELEGGLIRRLRAYGTPALALEAAGLEA